jgi:hypothetical protein
MKAVIAPLVLMLAHSAVFIMWSFAREDADLTVLAALMAVELILSVLSVVTLMRHLARRRAAK